MNPILVQHQLADLHRQELLRQAENAHSVHITDARTPKFLRNIAQTLVQVGEKLQETTPTSWSLVQPEAHLVK